MKGIDTNIIVYSLAGDYPEHLQCKRLFLQIAKGELSVVLSGITIMEAYHTLVYKIKYSPQEVKKRLIAIMKSKNINIIQITSKTVRFALELASQYIVGGRDALITANYLEFGCKEIFSHDYDFDKIPLLRRIDPIE
ncbi:MAG: type II toxin-antitoxin system VapC family toxin [Candidatus Lokiarchaeota archaeon]|nr:type II toxin-antitoxin system VapC family toxin [Candidatus Harpocratesius repetitus]